MNEIRLLIPDRDTAWARSWWDTIGFDFNPGSKPLEIWNLPDTTPEQLRASLDARRIEYIVESES